MSRRTGGWRDVPAQVPLAEGEVAPVLRFDGGAEVHAELAGPDGEGRVDVVSVGR